MGRNGASQREVPFGSVQVCPLAFCHLHLPVAGQLVEEEGSKLAHILIMLQSCLGHAAVLLAKFFLPLLVSHAWQFCIWVRLLEIVYSICCCLMLVPLYQPRKQVFFLTIAWPLDYYQHACADFDPCFCIVFLVWHNVSSKPHVVA